MTNRRHRFICRFICRAGSLIVLVIACGCSRSGDADTKGINGIISAGLSRDLYVESIPDGQIEILSALSASVEGLYYQNYTARRFAPSYLDNLRFWERQGLLTFQEHPQSSLEAIGRMGARTFTVIPDERLRSLADATLERDGYLRIRNAEATVEQIVSDTPYQSPALSASEQYRLVFGTYRAVPIPRFDGDLENLGGTFRDGLYRFKALLKFDPFTKTFTYVASDFGRIGETEWFTSRIQ